MQKINPFLWFNDNSVEAAEFYTSAFSKSKTVSTMPGPGGKPMGVTIELAGQTFILLNGGPRYHPNPSISFYVHCESNDQVDSIWNALSTEGKVMMALDTYPWSAHYGWVEDKYGVSWQIGIGTMGVQTPHSIEPTLMYTGNMQGRAEEAVDLYVSLFPNSSVEHKSRYEDGEPGPKGQIKHAGFMLNGQSFAAMDAHMPSPIEFTPGISLFINCDTAEEVDFFWEKLGDGGRYDRCGWLQDKFGVSWQVIPTLLGRLFSDSNRAKAGAAMQAMMQMSKIDSAELQAAFDAA